MSDDRRQPASPACFADQAPQDYMRARPLSRAELDAVLAALLLLEGRLGNAERRALIGSLLADPATESAEIVPTADAAAGLVRRMLPLVDDPAIRADLERLGRLYAGSLDVGS